VIVIDRLLFGGDSILSHLTNPMFSFHKLDITEADVDHLLDRVDIIYHLAAIVGFPACQAVGEAAAVRYNVEGTKRVFTSAERAGVSRFVFASTYSVYGVAHDGRPVTEESPLSPQSLYARTKIASEDYLRAQAPSSRCAPIIPRFTTLFGVSPRTRFDLLVNQFTLEALTKRKLVIFEGNYTRSFIHVRDIVAALQIFAHAPIDTVRGQTFNVGADDGNFSKNEIVEMICAAIPSVELEYRDLTFGADMRDVAVSCRKIRDLLGFRPSISAPFGIAEVRDAISSGLIYDPLSDRYRNHALLVH